MKVQSTLVTLIYIEIKNVKSVHALNMFYGVKTLSTLDI